MRLLYDVSVALVAALAVCARRGDAASLGRSGPARRALTLEGTVQDKMRSGGPVLLVGDMLIHPASATTDLDKALHAAHGEDPNKVVEPPKNETKTPPSRLHLTECHLNKTDPGAPFCLPERNTTWYINEIYDVTWDVDLIPSNSTVEVHVDYVDIPDNGGVTAFTTEKTDGSYGFVKIKTDKKWLQGRKKGNELLLTMVANSPKAGKRAKTFQGPQVTLKKKPKKPRSPHRSTPPSQHDMLVGIPLTLAILIAILILVFVSLRNHRRWAFGPLSSGGAGGGKRGKRRKGKFLGRSRGGGGAGGAGGGSSRMDSLAEEELLKYSDDYIEGLSTGTPAAQRERSRSRAADPRQMGLFTAQNRPRVV
ncbi:hypothetical protein KEM52_001956 [Ascosphaera acerosa]|nr:hypothetical protein KEM52_001956 [Ascosphaera acerosa]